MDNYCSISNCGIIKSWDSVWCTSFVQRPVLFDQSKNCSALLDFKGEKESE